MNTEESSTLLRIQLCMHKYKKAAINIALITIIFTTGLSSNVFAALSGGSDIDIESKLAKPDAKQEQVVASIEDDDYESWRKIVGKNSKVAKLIDQKSFDLFVRARNAARQGEYEDAINLTEAVKEQLAGSSGLG